MDEKWLKLLLPDGGFIARLAFNRHLGDNPLVAYSEFISLVSNAARVQGLWYTASLQHTAVLPGRLDDNETYGWGSLRIETSNIFDPELTLGTSMDYRRVIMDFLNERLSRWEKNNQWGSVSKNSRWLEPVGFAASCLTENTDVKNDFQVLELKDYQVMYYLGRMQGEIGHNIGTRELVEKSISADPGSKPTTLDVLRNFHAGIENLLYSALS